MTRRLPLLFACTVVLAVTAACTATSPESSETTDPSSTESTATEDDPVEEDTQDQTAATDDPSDPSTPSDSDRPTDSSVTVDLNGDSTVVEPTDVYCSGSPGNIEHIIGKTNNQLPLVEVSGSHFAMVKLEQRGAPERTQNPQGIDYGEDWVTFTDTSIGSATVNGAMVCTDWED